MTMYAEIDYGYGTAEFWGGFDKDTVEREFYRFARQCFGIRKSIAEVNLIVIIDEPLPNPWDKFEGATTVLKHSGDTIVWNEAGEKIKSEWE